MKSSYAILGIALLIAYAPSKAAEGLVTLKSPYTVQQTMNRLEGLVKERGLTVFARINHSAGAAKVGKSLRPTELLIFGNPQGGTPLMECAQTTAIDLPMKALVWEDAKAQVWLGYNDPAFIAKRHQAETCPAVANLTAVLVKLAQETLKPQPE